MAIANSELLASGRQSGRYSRFAHHVGLAVNLVEQGMFLDGRWTDAEPSAQMAVKDHNL
jgi:hypothetical protein